MTSINLYQDSSQQGGEKKESIMSSGFILSLSLLVVTLLVFGGVKIYSGTVAKQSTDLTAQIQQEKTAILGNRELDKLTDFQKRVDIIGADINSKEYVKSVIQNVAASMVGGMVLTNLSYDKGQISLTMNADGFQNVAQQIASFKTSPHFTAVSTTDISRNDSKISLSINMMSVK